MSGRKNYVTFRYFFTRLSHQYGVRTQKQLAHALGWSETKVNNYFNGVMPNRHNLLKLTEITGNPEFARLAAPDPDNNPFIGMDVSVRWYEPGPDEKGH